MLTEDCEEDAFSPPPPTTFHRSACTTRNSHNTELFFPIADFLTSYASRYHKQKFRTPVLLSRPNNL
ncbi:hypothetical protein MA16_Dca006223 [Dendrobium catenatum]|uniref:Uncharacterized protein n=1 Tax=Dendrobium catenatum TaxID=906689 RepID=A0A2I0X4U1_9ASPA|nr:hypothetical protein MA16_Dca006223 [Dendrobium catenatum]